MAAPSVVAHWVRSGKVGLSVVTAALDVDPRTADADVAFTTTVDETTRAIERASVGGPTLALYSSYSTDFDVLAAEVAAIRARVGDAALHVVGGVHATAEPASALAAGFDLAVVGEGEATAIAIAEALGRGADPRELPGTAHLAEGRLVTHGPGPRHPLDAFPPFNARHGKWNAIEITRGCVYACSFCQTPFAFKARFRHRSVADVAANVRALRAGGARYVRFLSPTSLSYGSEDESVDLGAVEALLAATREALGPDGKIYFGTFPSELRPEHVTPEALAVLRRWVDNDVLVIGGQSGSQRVLDAARRGHDVASIERAVASSIAAGFRPDVDLLLGLPGETREDREASLALAERLVARGARVHSHAFMPLPGTPLRAATPAPIEDDVALAMSRLESGGAMYGQWRKQVVTAERLRASARRR